MEAAIANNEGMKEVPLLYGKMTYHWFQPSQNQSFSRHPSHCFCETNIVSVLSGPTYTPLHTAPYPVCYLILF